MTERQIANRIKKIKELEEIQKEICEQIDALKSEIQAEMKDSEHINACGYVVNWVKVITNRLDTTKIKKELPDICNNYIKETHSRRFSISEI